METGNNSDNSTGTNNNNTFGTFGCAIKTIEIVAGRLEDSTIC